MILLLLNSSSFTFRYWWIRAKLYAWISIYWLFPKSLQLLFWFSSECREQKCLEVNGVYVEKWTRFVGKLKRCLLFEYAPYYHNQNSTCKYVFPLFVIVIHSISPRAKPPISQYGMPFLHLFHKSFCDSLWETNRKFILSLNQIKLRTDIADQTIEGYTSTLTGLMHDILCVGQRCIDVFEMVVEKYSLKSQLIKLISRMDECLLLSIYNLLLRSYLIESYIFGLSKTNNVNNNDLIKQTIVKKCCTKGRIKKDLTGKVVTQCAYVWKVFYK